MKHNKTLKDLNLLDRFLFAEAADDPEFMELVLEIILEKEIVLKHLQFLLEPLGNLRICQYHSPIDISDTEHFN